MIALFTDFGLADPYVGQIHRVLAQEAPGVAIVDLFHGVPSFDIRAGAYLLPAYAAGFPPGTVFLCVVDPGVGGPRRPVMLQADDGSWFVGPDNGLFHVLARRSRICVCRVIHWQPARVSASFHGRDLFAPVAARLARGEVPESGPTQLRVPQGPAWPDDLPQILHIDHYGNAVTGLRAAILPADCRLAVGGRLVSRARVFGDVAPGQELWYENANGLAEIAVNRGSAARALGLACGDVIGIVPAGG